MSLSGRFNNRMAETIAPFIGHNVLEIGAGIGNITRELMACKHYYASDINPYYLEMLEKFKESQPRLNITLLDLNSALEFAMVSKKFDTIICLNVLEHLDNDRRAMDNIATLLAPEGKAIILVPRGMWLYGSQDEVLGHKRRYSRKTLQELGSQAGLTARKLMGFNRISTLAWYVNGRFFQKKRSVDFK